MTAKTRTLIDLLRERASCQPDNLAYTFLEDGVAPAANLTYAALDTRARAIAARLQAVGAAGERALLLYPAGLEIICALFGCFYAGVVAIPAPPPEASRLKRTGPRLRAIADDAEASLVLTNSNVLGDIIRAETKPFEGMALNWVPTDRLPHELARHWTQPEIATSHLAYLQYTSGSTSFPKGVMISHRNVVFHLANLQLHCGYGAESATVTWMPYYHDYGLVEGLLEPLFNGTPCYVMSPLAFIKRPFHWLLAISRYRASHSQAPNFAYDHCVRRTTAEQRARLDLRSWKAAGIAAEPINPKVMRAFQQLFEPCGFAWQTFCPAYGLAEATLTVSHSPLPEEPLMRRFLVSALEKDRVAAVTGREDSGREIVSCGRLVGATKVAIVRPTTMTRCDPDEIGEIWVSDPAVAEGYWKRHDESEATFRAYQADSSEGPFLRTGDLGFLEDGQLFVTGRLKDVIIVRGANHYPQDIEWTVQCCHPALRPDNGAAFSVIEDGTEKLVVAQELEREYLVDPPVAEIITAIRTTVAEDHELDVCAVYLLRRGSIPKTASGKIQRRACHALMHPGNPDVVAAWTRLSGVSGAPNAGTPPVPVVASEMQPNGRVEGVEILL
jgi:acyl-CoA synthetase (AMP-forming)/AMP-acid ligase II